MELSEYQNIFDHEETHFFYRTNHSLIIALLQKYRKQFSQNKKISILDAGCGTGLLLKKLAQFGNAEGVDISPEALKFCRKRKVKAKQGSLNQLPFSKNSFDIVVSVDVLYHQLVNEKKAVAQMQRVLKPGGLLIMRVPANKWLKLAHDRHVHTKKRYTTGEVRLLFSRAGFKVLETSYVNQTFLILAITKFILELLAKKKGTKSGVDDVSPLLNKVLMAIGMIEVKIFRFVKLPFGLGVMAVVQKKTDSEL